MGSILVLQNRTLMLRNVLVSKKEKNSTIFSWKKSVIFRGRYGKYRADTFRNQNRFTYALLCFSSWLVLGNRGMGVCVCVGVKNPDL